ncbi:Cytochrome P450 [Mycena venus]|uniref:Cytochrome P450 n=1 Tax=Mycena venus TaxID=2733690 RepID=A0A8H6XX56_9AGAR|nr:Cytochrome P450 [Mycena venus]
MNDPKPFMYGVLAILIIYGTRSFVFRSKIDAIPSIGYLGLYYLGAIRFLRHGEEMVQEGYKKYKGVIFRVPFLSRWGFVATGPALVKEIFYTPDDILSLDEAMHDALQVDLTLGPEIREDPHHIQSALAHFTRTLGRRFPEMRDEVVCAFDDILGASEKDWKPVPVLSTIMPIVSRISNRLFVGLHLCRDPEFLKFSMQHTVDVVVAGRLIGFLPNFLRPVFGPLISSRKRNMHQAMKMLGPLVAERIAMLEEHGTDWADKPNDLISSLLEIAQPKQRNVYSIVQRILIVILAAIHTSSITFGGVLLDLATYQHYIQPLREEVESVVEKYGWTKAALNNMHKIDSFIRESQRMNGLNCLASARMVVHPDGFRFSDGTFLPSGSIVNVPIRAIHHDSEIHPDPEVFDALRSYNMGSSTSDSDPESRTSKHRLVTTEPTHLSFGHGKHACPGRFFAAAELKAMLAHLVMNYDMKLEIEGVRPPDQVFEIFRVPDPKMKVWFRKRKV